LNANPYYLLHGRINRFFLVLPDSFANRIAGISVLPKVLLFSVVDEKSQIQALDRTRSMLPMRPNKARRQTQYLHSAWCNAPARRFARSPLYASSSERLMVLTSKKICRLRLFLPGQAPSCRSFWRVLLSSFVISRYCAGSIEHNRGDPGKTR
jgi:hypothetical protein